MTATIWLISKYAAPQKAAKVGARCFLLLREFARLGHRTVMITSDSNHVAKTPTLTAATMDEEQDGVLVRWVRTLKYPSPASPRRILSWFDFEWRLLRMPHESLPKPDIVIVSSLSLLTVLTGLRLRRRFKCKLVFEVRDIWPLLLYDAGKVSPYHPLCLFLGMIERLGYRQADLIVGTMPNLGEHVKESIGRERPMLCVPQGLEAAHLAESLPISDDYVENYIPRNKFILCYAGSIGADNALETLFSCARKMQHRTDIQFLIVGDGYLKSSFEKACADLDNVTFAPKVEKAAVQSVLEKVDVVYFAVHRSPALRFGQSLNKLIDYMASGKPVIASYSGYPSMINEAQCGIMVPAEDVDALRQAIEEYADMDPVERAHVGARGKQWLIENRTYPQLSHTYLTGLGLT